MKPHYRKGTPCEVEGCQRVVMSKKGRTKCREHHRLTVVWKNASNQRNNQCCGFTEPIASYPPRTKQLTVAESGDHLMSLLKRVCDFDISPVKRYFKCSVETAELFQRYAA